MTTALERLQSLIPPPAANTRPWRWDWAETERRLGYPLPQDYKDLVDVYGRGEFDNYLRLMVGLPNKTDSGIVLFNQGHMDDLRHFWSGLVERPDGLAENDVLVTLADTIDADTINWVVRPGEAPEQWPVAVLHSDLEDCEIYSMTCTELLAGLFAGEIVSDTLSHQLALALSFDSRDSHFFDHAPPYQY
jgi:hypothetical protein